MTGFAVAKSKALLVTELEAVPKGEAKLGAVQVHLPFGPCCRAAGSGHRPAGEEEDGAQAILNAAKTDAAG